MGLCKSFPHQAERMSFAGTYQAYVTKIVDGDTLHVIIKFRGVYDTHTLRLIGIDTPEIHQCSPREKAIGEKVKNWLTPLVGQRITVVVSNKREHFGRLLGQIILPCQKDLCEHMLSLGLGKAYDGKRARVPFTPQELTNVERAIRRAPPLVIRRWYSLCR